MTGVARWWVGVAIAGLVATTSVPRGWYGASARLEARASALADAQASVPSHGGSLVATVRSRQAIRHRRAFWRPAGLLAVTKHVAQRNAQAREERRLEDAAGLERQRRHVGETRRPHAAAAAP